ncbi:MAG TPA: aromatic ring-hydroxylating dioxygenase subunit alpha [Stellaceae bacterium]|nr:aromatic ring-hydroxylating dioxygenase subunit alpha [Stellaceae bacterium]
MEGNRSAPLRQIWYYAMPSRALRPGTVTPRLMLGEPVVIGRDRDGTAFALRDICPHRGVPLSGGRFDGAEIQCPYHGWRFDRAGQCKAIPSLTPSDNFDVGRIRVKPYPVVERYGNIWVFFGSDPAAAPDVPALPGIASDRQPDLTMKMQVPCGIDAAVFGQMDPTHNPFVHVSWWWRKPGSITEKAKEFAPAPYGFMMLPHPPSSNLSLYRLLRGTPETRLFFHLPSTRIEHTRFGRDWFVTLNTVTPIDDDNIEMCYAAYWSPWWLTAIKPLLLWGLRTFAFQDRAALTLQSKGLRFNPALMLVDDADTQAKWYHRLKNEYQRAGAEGRPFENPVKARTLRFRS